MPALKTVALSAGRWCGEADDGVSPGRSVLLHVMKKFPGSIWLLHRSPNERERIMRPSCIVIVMNFLRVTDARLTIKHLL